MQVGTRVLRAFWDSDKGEVRPEKDSLVGVVVGHATDPPSPVIAENRIKVQWDGVPGVFTYDAEDLIWEKPVLFVNVFLEDRMYGGPEEGGWYYDAYVELESSQFYSSFKAATDALVEARELCQQLNAERNSDIYSVCSEGRYVAYIQDQDGETILQSQRRPSYC